MKKTRAFAKKAISAMAAFALVATMCPAGALAAEPATPSQDGASAAQDAGSSASASASIVSEEVAIVPATSQDAPEQPAAPAEPAAEEAPEPSSAPGVPAQVNASDADIDMLAAQVALSDSASGALIVSGGLAYAVNADAPDTVSLVGWTGNAPQGALTIPHEVRSGDKGFAVTRICAGGGQR